MTIPNSINEPAKSIFTFPTTPQTNPSEQINTNVSLPTNKMEKDELIITPEREKVTTQKTNPIDRIIDTISQKVVNQNDINDSVQVPRSIFKGYLFFFVGTSIGAINGLLKGANTLSKITKGALTAATAVITAVGTFEFVKPYLVKNGGNKEGSDV